MSSFSPPGISGTVSRRSNEMFNWYLVDIPPIGKSVLSPAFHFGKCLWHLEILTSMGNFYIFLARDCSEDDLGPEDFEVTLALGWRKADGALVERGSVQWAFRRGDFGPWFFIQPSINRYDEFRATKTVTCRFIGGEETEPRQKQIEDSSPGISTRHTGENTSGHRAQVIGTVSRGSNGIFNWYLVDIPTNTKGVRSPAFRFGKCLWHLGVNLMGSKYGHLSMHAYLKRERSADNLGPEKFEVTHALGLMKADGAVLEKGSVQWAFRKGEFAPLLPIILSIKDRDEFLATKTVTCHFIGGEETELRPKQIEALDSLSSDFRHLLNSGENSDVVLNVQGREFRAHRLVLSARSPVFRATFSHDCEEKRTGVVDITDCDPESFSHLLQFLYSGKVGELTFDTTVGLYMSADKYGVQALKFDCSDRLRRNLTPEKVSEVAVLADLHSDEELASAAQLFFNKKYFDVLLTTAWTTVTKNHLHVAEKLLKEMSPKKRSRTADKNVSSADPEVKKKRLKNSD